MDEMATTSGPIFDGRAQAAAAEAVIATRKALGKSGAALAAAAFNSAIRQNGGKFVGSITVIEKSTTFSTGDYTMQVDVPMDCDVVTTDIASYGPWLEGVGSRNDTTRFKGYFGFRRASQELDQRAGAIADTTIIPYVERMN